MEKEFDLLVFVGRFQPFHLGHKAVIDRALELSKNVLILIGSAGSARTIRNPFTFEERSDMITKSYLLGNCSGVDFKNGQHDAQIRDRIIIRPLYDKMYNDTAWIEQVQSITKDVILQIANPSGFATHGINDVKVGLIGASKDNTSYYLKLFPQWKSVDVPIQGTIHATGIRDGILYGQFERYQLQDTLLTKQVCDLIFDEFAYTEEFTQLQNEIRFVRDYKKQWEVAPYPVKHMTVDAVVEQSGHVLLVRRKSAPGKGLWALPGGHLNLDETTLNGAIRELREETKIKVPDPVLKGSIVNKELFDNPHRSTIGRVITHAFHFKLNDDIKLPKVKGSDDADKAKWVPISELVESDFFDDHYHVIQYFLGV